jgi:YidC/Oxa1 family membrane protein insertase
MDQKRLFAAIALSIGILLLFDLWNRPTREAERQRAQQQQAAQQVAPATPPAVPVPASPGGAAAVTLAPDQAAAPGAASRAPEQRLRLENPRLDGSIGLRGARLDDLVLKGYRETTQANSPLVRLFAPRGDDHPYFAQWGWTAADGRTRVPDADTDWTAEGGPLAPGRPVTLRWDNGAGQEFRIALELDADFMLSARQSVLNRSAEPVQVLPWARIRRERTPQVAGFFILHEGFTGVLEGRLTEWTYSDAKAEAERRRGTAMEQESTGGWAGFTDKYWLTALTPVDQADRVRAAYRHVSDAGQDRWQVDIAPPGALAVAAGSDAAFATRLFAGAKEVNLLDGYRDSLGIVDFDKAIDFGWFYFLTKPFFHVLHFFGATLFGNFGVAILVFTLLLKAAFFPLANKSYKSMARMKVLAPKMTEIRERYKDDPTKAQQEMMALYRSEKINPASGCLPILCRSRSSSRSTRCSSSPSRCATRRSSAGSATCRRPIRPNLFNLFGLLPFDPMQICRPASTCRPGPSRWASRCSCSSS